MNVRIPAVVICVSSWLLIGSATAAGPLAVSSKNPAMTFRPANRDLVQSTSILPTRFSRLHGSSRHRSANESGFPLLPPTERTPAGGVLEPLASQPSEFAFDDSNTRGPFRFEHNGGAVVRSIPRGYHRMCDSLSGHVWNEPNGKRICFDTRGKPGIAIQIPIR